MSGADVFRFVSRRELLYTIQSLKALEHCLLPFLDDCDTDNDDKITLWEWGRCLGLEGTISQKLVRKHFVTMVSSCSPSLN